MGNSKTDTETVTEALLDPVDRLSEIMFGLLMVLTFTGTMSVALGDGGTVRGILAAAIGCNVAWGIVDGVMYLLQTVTAKRRTFTIIDDIRRATPEDRPGFVTDLISNELTRNLSDAELRDIADWLTRTPATAETHALRATDFWAAIAIVGLVILSTFPPILPFLLMDDLFTAMRWSNFIAVAMLFAIGWQLDRHIHKGSRLMRIIVPLIGVTLVVVTIALGG